MQSRFVPVPVGAQLLGFGSLEVRSADCLGMSDGLGAWSFSFLISAKQTSSFALSAMFVVPIFHSISIIETIDKYLFSIPVSNPAYRSTSAAFAGISVTVETRPHMVSKPSWYLLQYSCMSLQSDTSGKYMSGRSRWRIGNPPDPHGSTPEYSRSSFEHSEWLYGYPDLFQSFVIGYLSTLIYSGAFYWIVEYPYLFQSFSLDRISTYLTLIIFKPNIYIN